MNVVQQRADWDCVLACLAMWTGRPYDELLELYKVMDPAGFLRQQGVSGSMKEAIMSKLGMEPIVLTTAYGAVPGILSFPSLNNPGGGHAVFYDGYRSWDPQTDREDRKWYKPDHSPFPGCYQLTIDINHEYSREMFEVHLKHQGFQLRRAKGEA